MMHSESRSFMSSDERYRKVLASASEVFGDAEKAWRWLTEPCRFFEGRVPAEMLILPTGYDELLQHLFRIEQGAFISEYSEFKKPLENQGRFTIKKSTPA